LNTPKHIVIIGGGISGLAAAHRLTELARDGSVRFTLIEAGSRLGGILRTERRDGFILEGGPDAFISEKPEAVALAERLGIADRLIQTNPQHRRSFIVRGGKLRPIPEGFHLMAPSRFWPFATSGVCSIGGKLRMAGEAFLPQRWETGHDESLASFVRRRFGQEALERLAQPLVGGIYTADPELLSLRATMPRFLEMERKHGSVIRAMLSQRAQADRAASGARYSLFLSFDQGMQVLTDTLAARLPAESVRLQTRVTSTARTGSQWVCQTDKGETISGDGLCLAVPAYRAAELLRETDGKLADELGKIEFASSATINLAYRADQIAHKLDGFGFVVPFVEKRTVMACTFSSVKFAGRAPAGMVLLRAFVGGALQPDVFALDDHELVARAVGDVENLLGISAPAIFTHLERWPRSMPQYHLGHLERIERIEGLVATLPGLALAGNSYRGAGIPDCIRSGESAAEKNS
jgi:oxygen-dependent protoporphyrinogen oxidase